MMKVNTLDAFAFVAILALAYSWLSWSKRRFPLPPGPAKLPIIGNIFDVPARDEWETVRQWREKYGDIVYVNILGKDYLFANTFEAAVELLEKRGNIYSNRPRTTMLELEGWCDWNVTLMSESDELQAFRQYFGMFFQKTAVKNHYEIQEQSTHKLLLRLLENRDSYREHVKHWAAETIIKIAYGFEITENDPNVELVDKAAESIVVAMSFFAVNALPALRHLPTWFPGAHFHKIAQEGRRLSVAMRNEPYLEAKRKMAEGSAGPSIVSKMLELFEDKGETGPDESMIINTASIAYGGGGDTTVAALLTFILAMVLHPDAAKKGQEELDRVIGRNNLPTLEDKSRLPYIEAICAECLRWQPVAPFGIPHCVEKDDIYNGYLIPAGTTILPNIWGMLRDPKRYSDPEKFIPDRWLPSRDEERPLDSNRIAFGFGRRICPGRFFAETSVFIGVASILAAFDIQKATDEHGVPITPSEDYTSTLIRRPEPFKCRITPRSDEMVVLIRQAAAAATRVTN